MNRVNRSAFSGASAFPVVEHTTISACFLLGVGSVSHLGRHFFLKSFNSVQITSVKEELEGDTVEARSLAMCCEFPVAEP